MAKRGEALPTQTFSDQKGRLNTCLLFPFIRRNAPTVEASVEPPPSSESIADRSPDAGRHDPTVDAMALALAALRRGLQTSLDGLDALNQHLNHANVSGRPQRLATALKRSHESLLSQLDEQINASTGSATPTAAITPSPFSLGDLAEDVVAMFWNSAATKGLDLAIYVDPATPSLMLGDPNRLQQILAALIDEAIVETEDGGVLIEVEPGARGLITVSIHDTRPLLPDAASDAVQASLELNRRRVEAMGGVLALARQNDLGVSIFCRLPLEALEPAEAWPRLLQGAEGTDAPFALVSYPGPCTRRALVRYLSAAGFAVRGPQIVSRMDQASLIISDARGLERMDALAAPALCIARPEDAAPARPPNAVSAPTILRQPVQRREIEAYLRQLAAGESLTAPVLKVGGALSALPKASLPAPPPEATEVERDLLRDLDQAVRNGGLSLVYQPQVDREGERIIGVEALVRWLHPRLGPISPAVFIPLAERYGQIKGVTAWVTEQVLVETKYLHGLQVSFNASALEFSDTGFVDSLLAAVSRHDYDARRLEVEITETAILQHEEPVQESMARLHAAGVGVALDDFGAGHSSLSHLRRYPFDKLKIDREFITDCSGDMQAATVVHAVVSIGRALGMKVIAEGVETEVQRNFLRLAGVYAMQGFLFGKPAPIDHLSSLITPQAMRARR
jgi:EAL domain-containing protein (putative c-di-GMP-specific phosphodiesterase class I)